MAERARSIAGAALLRPVPQAGTVMVAGPPRYVELVEQAAQTLAKPPAPPPAGAITVYRGSNAQQVQPSTD